MATDYDAPRRNEDEPEADSLEELTTHQKDQSSAAIEEDENEIAEGFELPGADLSREELSVHVVPQLEDEFTCSECSWYTTAASWLMLMMPPTCRCAPIVQAEPKRLGLSN